MPKQRDAQFSSGRLLIAWSESLSSLKRLSKEDYGLWEQRTFTLQRQSVWCFWSCRLWYCNWIALGSV